MVALKQEKTVFRCSDDFGIVMNEKATCGYFSSDRPGGAGRDDIYAFKKTATPIEIYVFDETTLEPIEGATVIMKDKNNGDVQTLTTDANGEFMDPLKGYDCPGGLLDYDVTIAKDGFTPKKVNFTKAITKPGIVEFEERLFKIGGDVKEFCQIEDILYDFNKSYIRPDAAIELDKLVKCMNDNPEMIVEIGSHTDCRASRRYNEKLSSRRAKSAREYVISKGIAAYRIYGRGYGEDVLLEPCPCEPTNRSDCDEDQHQLNRRTEFRIVSGGDNVKNNSTNSF